MQTEKYRKLLNKAITLLWFTEDLLLTNIKDMALAGVYSDIAEIYDDKDFLFIEEEYFEDTDDGNIEILMGVMKRLRYVKWKMLRLNDMDQSELCED